jgi:HlyD family secretion protein
MSKILPPIGLAAALIAASPWLTACHPASAAKPRAAALVRSVSVLVLSDRAVASDLAATGDLVSREEAAVLPEVNGYRAAEVLADVGQFVRLGQPLVRLDPALIRAQIAQQTALTAQAQAQADQAEDQARRTEGMDGSGELAQEQINQRRFQARAATANAQAQKAALDDLRTREAKLLVTAPVSGLVLERTVRPGDLSGTGTTAWFRLARDGQVELQAQMAEDELNRIRPGATAMVTLPSGLAVSGHVRLVSPQIDPQTKLGYVRITLPVRPDVRAGGFGRASFGDPSGIGLAVPETAIRYDADSASVMVVDAQDRVRRVRVKTGERGGGWVRLTSGPPVGARVVQNAAAFLVDGDKVRPVPIQVASGRGDAR